MLRSILNGNNLKNNDLKSKTIEQLQAKLRVNKVVSITLVVVLTLLTTSTIYGLITKEDISTLSLCIMFKTSKFLFTRLTHKD